MQQLIEREDDTPAALVHSLRSNHRISAPWLRLNCAVFIVSFALQSQLARADPFAIDVLKKCVSNVHSIFPEVEIHCFDNAMPGRGFQKIGSKFKYFSWGSFSCRAIPDSKQVMDDIKAETNRCFELNTAAIEKITSFGKTFTIGNFRIEYQAYASFQWIAYCNELESDDPEFTVDFCYGKAPTSWAP